MKIIALEEHFLVPEISRMRDELFGLEDWLAGFGEGGLDGRLADLGAARIEDMERDGIDLQVLSLTSPGVQDLPRTSAASLAREANDVLRQAVVAHPDHFDGLATLSTQDPEAAVEELRRSVGELGFKGAMISGRTGDRNVDHPDLDAIFGTAAELQVPIFFHPQWPPKEVRDQYYSGWNQAFDGVFAGWAVGWHYETGVQLLRLIYSGAFDRYPGLQVVLGHWGELIPFYLERIQQLDEMGLGLERTLPEYLRENVYVTGSGMLSQRYLRWTVEVLGVERIMYSADYPYRYVGDGSPRRFLEEADLSDLDKERIAHGNWEGLTSR